MVATRMMWNRTALQKPDATRLADIRQLASALELYYNDTGVYPDQLASLVPNYISAIPKAPASKSRICSKAENTYTYARLSGSEYKMTFCQSTKTSGITAGKHTLTQSGIY